MNLWLTNARFLPADLSGEKEGKRHLPDLVLQLPAEPLFCPSLAIKIGRAHV